MKRFQEITLEAPGVRSFGRFPDLTIALLAILVIPAAGGYVADLVYLRLPLLDPDEAFLWISVHHTAQLGLTLLLLCLLGGTDLSRWGFNLRNWKRSLVWILAFSVFWLVVQYSRISDLPDHGLPWPLTTRNMFGVQAFQYLLSGLGEEPLFRGFVIVFLASRWKGIVRVFEVEISLPVLFSVLFFMLAHLDLDLRNFTLSQIDFDQQMMSLQLGLVYGICFHYTRSLLAPIVMHGVSNGVQFTLLFLVHG